VVCALEENIYQQSQLRLDIVFEYLVVGVHLDWKL